MLKTNGKLELAKIRDLFLIGLCPSEAKERSIFNNRLLFPLLVLRNCNGRARV